MDEVRVERLIQKYKDNGELDSDDPALVILKKWPAAKEYQYNSDCLPGLEQLVCYTIYIVRIKLHHFSRAPEHQRCATGAHHILENFS